MLNKFAAAAIALSAVAGIAYAAGDQPTPPTAPTTDQAQQAPQAQDQGQGGWWGRMRGHHDMRGMRGRGGPMDDGMMGQLPPGHPPVGQGMMGGRGMMGGPGMMMGRGQGFRLQLGPNISVGLMCGTQAMKDCIAEAQPLIDAAKAAALQAK